MDIDKYFQLAKAGDKKVEAQLFSYLTGRFLVFVELKVRDYQDSQDVVQNTISVILKKYKNLDIDYSFSAWCYKVLNFEILKYYRDRGKHQKYFVDLKQAENIASIRSSDPILRQKLLNCMKHLFSKNRRYAKVIHLKRIGYETDKICSIMSINSSNLYKLLGRARNSLKNCLEKGI